MSIRKLRLEYSILLERLEERVSETGEKEELMSAPPNPTLLDDSLNMKVIRNNAPKARKGKVSLQANGGTKSNARDPDLPKRPTNAYLMFCDKEKERIKTDLMASNSGSAAQDVSKILAEAWRCLDDDQKKPYQVLYEEDKERYKKEMMEYNKRKPSVEPRQNTNAQRAQEENVGLKHPGEELEQDTPKRLKYEEGADDSSITETKRDVSQDDSRIDE